MKRVTRRIFSGVVCEQIVYNMPDSVKNIRAYKPKLRFKDDEEREAHKLGISRRKHAQIFNDNFSPSSLYSTLTFDTEFEVHTFQEARQIRRNFRRVLLYAYPDAVVFIYMGRGKSTHRIHFHMVSDGIPEEFIDAKWKYGSVKRISHLREHNYYDGVDHGKDYTGLANYLFDHWTPEQGGHHWMQTKNARKPEPEDPEELEDDENYSAENPPEPPKGYKLVETKATKYGYLYFKYVLVPPKDTRKRTAPKTGYETG